MHNCWCPNIIGKGVDGCRQLCYSIVLLWLYVVCCHQHANSQRLVTIRTLILNAIYARTGPSIWRQRVYELVVENGAIKNFIRLVSYSSIYSYSPSLTNVAKFSIVTDG